jgi:ABC-type transport system involved in multi-copper enzyme maturation permease subunit
VFVSSHLISEIAQATENSLTAVKPIPYSLTPWMGLAVLMLYAAAVVGAGTWLLARRDA